MADMDEQELEDALNTLCDSSGLTNAEIAEVLALVKSRYDMLRDDEEPGDQDA